MITTKRLAAAGLAAGLAAAFAVPAAAVPPDDVYAKLVQIGRVVDAPGTTAIYGPMLANQSYDGVTISRDIPYAADPRAILNVAGPSERGTRLRPVLIYVPGGGGNKQLDYEGGKPFLDNMNLAAVHHGLVGVVMQRVAPRGGPWDSGAHDIAAVIQWVHENIERYGGDPRRVVIWGQSAGANNLSNYLSHKEFWPGGRIGVKAAVVMSGGYNLAPLQAKAVNSAPRGPGDGGAAAIRSPAPPPPPVDPAALLQRSTLPGFRALKIKTLVSAAELDPERTVESSEMLKDVMCKAGNCPDYMLFAKESHMSEILSINSDDKEVEGPVFAWIVKAAR